MAGATLVDCVLRLGRGDDVDAWDHLAIVAGGALARTCARIAGPDLGQDALQECLLRVRRLARGFRAPDAGGEAAAMAWLQRVAATTACQALRGRRRALIRDHAHAAAPVTDDDAHDAVERSERHALLRRELARLPTAHREAVALHHLAGEPIAAVALAQGIGEEAAKKRVQRGVATLRDRLARCGLALAAAALPAALADAAESAPLPDPSAAASADASALLPTATTLTGIIAMTAAACVPAVVLAFVVWHGVAGESAPLPVGMCRRRASPRRTRRSRRRRWSLASRAGGPPEAAGDVRVRGHAVPGRDRILPSGHRCEHRHRARGVRSGGGGTVTLRAKDMQFGVALKWVVELSNMHLAIKDGAISIAKAPIADAETAGPADAPSPTPGNEPWRAAIAQALTQEVTLDFQDNDLVETVNFLQKISGINIVIDPAVVAAAPPPVTLKVKAMKLENVLESRHQDDRPGLRGPR